MSCWPVNSFDFTLEKTALTLKHSCNFSREKSNELTDQQDMFYNKAYWLHRRAEKCCLNEFFIVRLKKIGSLNNRMHKQSNDLTHWPLGTVTLIFNNLNTFHWMISPAFPVMLPLCESHRSYRQVSNIRCTKSQHLKCSSTVLRLSLPNPLKPDVKSRMKMQLEQRRQTMLQLHLSDRQFYCLLRCVLY